MKQLISLLYRLPTPVTHNDVRQNHLVWVIVFTLLILFTTLYRLVRVDP